MAADLTKLTPAFRTSVTTLLTRCAARRIVMRPYFTIRAPQEQGKLWRQSRSIEEINAKILMLEQSGAPFLARCIKQAGPQHGDPVTNAVPGLSWHQWGEALDCFWLVDGEAEWSSKKLINGQNGYRVYAEEAVKLRLTAGGYFASLKDWPHVQLRAAASPLATKTLPEIDAAMKLKFDV